MPLSQLRYTIVTLCSNFMKMRGQSSHQAFAMKMRAVKKTNNQRFILTLMLSAVIIIGGRSKKVVLQYYRTVARRER